mgnify:CR=1 FL=1
MSTVIDLFERHGYVLELLACVAATTWKLERQERFAVRLTGILLAEVCFTIVWEQVPHNLYTESLRTFLLWSIAAVGIRLCFRIAAAWAVFYATAAGTMQHIIYRGAKLLQNAVYHMDRQYWAWSRWVYLGLFVLLFAVCCLTLTRRLHSRNLGTLPGRTMTFIMVGYQLSMNIFVNLFNAFSVDGAPRIFTTYSVYDEVTTILLFFLLCEILQRSDAEWDNMVLQQMMRQQRQQMELSKETVELINIKCHDIRKQLYTLGSRVPTEELDELTDRLEAELKTCKESGCQYAENEAEYRKALRIAILNERQKGTPVTIIGDVCRGQEQIAEAKRRRDCSEAIYKASQEAINVIKLRIRMVDAQITRIWNSGDVTQGGYP